MGPAMGALSVIKTVSEIVAEHRSGAVSPEDTIAQCYARIRAHADPAIFISLRDEADARAEARALSGHPRPRTFRCSACRSR